MEGRQVIQILVGPVLKYERAEGGGASRGDEACFIEKTHTQGLYPCSLTLVGVVKITHMGPLIKLEKIKWV
jgi:hypothetical protein